MSQIHKVVKNVLLLTVVLTLMGAILPNKLWNSSLNAVIVGDPCAPTIGLILDANGGGVKIPPTTKDDEKWAAAKCSLGEIVIRFEPKTGKPECVKIEDFKMTLVDSGLPAEPKDPLVVTFKDPGPAVPRGDSKTIDVIGDITLPWRGGLDTCRKIRDLGSIFDVPEGGLAVNPTTGKLVNRTGLGGAFSCF